MILHRLKTIVRSQADINWQSYEHMKLQDEMFRWMTGVAYGEKLKPNFLVSDDGQNRSFFNLIGEGILAYRLASWRQQSAFNQAVMPKKISLSLIHCDHSKN